MTEVKTANVDTQTVETIEHATISDDDDLLCGIPSGDVHGELLTHVDNQPIILIPEDASYTTSDSALLNCGEPTDNASLQLTSDAHSMMVVDESGGSSLMPDATAAAEANGICAIVSSIEGGSPVGVPVGSLDSVALTAQTDVDGENMLPASAVNGHQLIIIMADGTVAAVQQAGSEVAEPPVKRFKVEVDNDKAYLLAVTDTYADDASNDTGASESTKEPQLPKTQQPISLPDRGQPNDVTQAWFTTRDDKVALQNKGQTWKQGQWCKEEVQLLEANINNYCKENNIAEVKDVVFDMSKDERKDFYRTIARGLNRPLFSVYRRVIRMYDKKNHVGKYTPEELEKLKELRCQHGSDWASIGAVLGRSASSVKDRCRLMKETCNSGKWLPEEEKRLADAVYEQSGLHPGDNITSGLSWAAVAEKVSTRSEKQCRTKWLNYLNWKQSGGSEWTREDDIQLVEKISNSRVTDETQIDWVQLSRDWSSVRSPQWLRGKWWSMKRYVVGYQVLSFPEVVECVRQMNQQLRGTKPLPLSSGTGGILRLGKVDFQNQHVATIPNIISIPVMGTESSPVMSTTTVGGQSGAAAASYETYEVLQGYEEGSTQPPPGTFLVRQPQNSPVLSFATANNASDHIIVHTLPVVQMSQNEHMTTTMDAPMLVNENSRDPTITGEMNDSDHIAASIQLAERINHSDDEDLTCQIDDSPLDAVGQLHGEHVAVERVHDTHTTGGLSVSSAAVSVVTTTQSELMHMSSFSDPMMMSDSSHLMCSASDMDDGKDPSQDTDSLDAHD